MAAIESLQWIQGSTTRSVLAQGRGVEARRGVVPRTIGGLPTVLKARRGSTNYSVTGQTLDSAGSPLGGMTVYLLQSGSMTLIDTQVSDGSGNYILVSPTNAGFFMVVAVHSNGSIAGVTRPVLEAI